MHIYELSIIAGCKTQHLWYYTNISSIMTNANLWSLVFANKICLACSEGQILVYTWTDYSKIQSLLLPVYSCTLCANECTPVCAGPGRFRLRTVGTGLVFLLAQEFPKSLLAALHPVVCVVAVAITFRLHQHVLFQFSSSRPLTLHFSELFGTDTIDWATPQWNGWPRSGDNSAPTKWTHPRPPNRGGHISAVSIWREHLLLADVSIFLIISFNMSGDKDSNTVSKKEQGLFEEDDEFEEFPTDGVF